MAYFRKINNNCQGKGGRCPRMAAFEVFDRTNVLDGRYCSNCADKRVVELNELEAAEAKRLMKSNG